MTGVRAVQVSIWVKSQTRSILDAHQKPLGNAKQSAVKKGALIKNQMKNPAIYYFIIFAMSLLLPSSINGNISQVQISLWQLVCISMVMFTVSKTRPIPVIKSNFVMGSGVVFLLLLFTVLSPLNGTALGAIVPYLVFVTVLSVDFRRVALNTASIKVFVLSASVILLFGWGIVTETTALIEFQQSHYQMFYDDLFEQMVGWSSKPVSVYATHSLAAFAYFAFSMTFFAMARFEKRVRVQLVWLAFGLGFFALIPWLVSTTAVGLLFIGFAILLFQLVRLRRYFLLTWIVFFVFIGGLLYGNMIIGFINVVFNFDELFNSAGNGFSGRFSAGSRLSSTYQYLLENYFWPIGLSNDTRLGFGDNFIAEYVLRLSPIGYILILVMLYKFLRKNLQSKKTAISFFVFFLIGDQGYPLLTSFRFIFMLPVLIIMWNGMQQPFVASRRKIVLGRRTISRIRWTRPVQFNRQ